MGYEGGCVSECFYSMKSIFSRLFVVPYRRGLRRSFVMTRNTPSSTPQYPTPTPQGRPNLETKSNLCHTRVPSRRKTYLNGRVLHARLHQ